MKSLLFTLFFTLKIIIIKAQLPHLAEHALQIHGNASLGYYYVKIFVGEPPQEQTVIIDTGSGQLALPCNKCKKCSKAHINPPFDMGKSKTAEYVTCQSNDSQCQRCANRIPTQSCTFSISYAEGSSLQGIIIKDSIRFQSSSKGEEIVTSFGCTTTETNLFLKQEANGIFGLAPERKSNLLEQIYRKHHKHSGQQLQFSLCLTANGGQMVVGGINKQLITNQQPVHIDFSSHSNLYSMNRIKQITMGNIVIHQQNEKFGQYGIFIDSGSTFTYLPKKNYEVFKAQLIKKCNLHQRQCEIAEGESTFCFHLIGNQQIQKLIEKIFDPVQIHVSNSTLGWSPLKYFLMRDIKNREICLGVQALDRYLLGANWMIDRNIVFNLKERSLSIYNDVDCRRKQTTKWQMGYYSNLVQGHRPLTYKSSKGTVLDVNIGFTLALGIFLIFFGTLGVMLMLRRKNIQKTAQKHSQISDIQAEQNILQLNN